MIKNPLQNFEAFETIALVGLGVTLLLTLEPVSPTRLFLAGILAAILFVLVAASLWGRLHDHR